MSRHRDVRSMNYSDEYDGYDDVYGHSVEDDYCVSPGAEQFLFDRNKQQNISSFFTEPDIEEDNEEEAAAEAERYTKPQLNDLELAKLASCIEAVRNVIGDTISEASLTEKIIKSNYNAEIVLDAILKETPPKTSVEISEATGSNKDRLNTLPGFSPKTPSNCSSNAKPSFAIPKLSFGTKKTRETPELGNSSTFSSLSALMANHEKSSPSCKKSQETPSPKLGNATKFSSLSALMANHEKSSPSSSSPQNEQSKKSFGTLADLTAHHLQRSNSTKEAPENFNVSTNSPKANFVIPKFSSSKGNSSNKTIAQPPQFSLSTSRESVASLEKSPSNVQISMDSNKENSSTKIEENSHQEQTTPDELTIDLSAALRLVELKPSVKSEKVDIKMAENSEDIFNDKTHDLVPCVEYVKFISGLECKMNLSHLRHVQLNYSNRNLSLFGKMLCKRWRSRKPFIKKIRPQQHHHSKKIVRFDFSTPSPDSLILSKLRRR